MKRVSLYLDKDDYDYLRQLSGVVSEHIRSAVSEYIRNIKQLTISTSKSKEGGKNE